jgi:hypothetical protein
LDGAADLRGKLGKLTANIVSVLCAKSADGTYGTNAESGTNIPYGYGGRNAGNADVDLLVAIC